MKKAILFSIYFVIISLFVSCGSLKIPVSNIKVNFTNENTLVTQVDLNNIDLGLNSEYTYKDIIKIYYNANNSPNLEMTVNLKSLEDDNKISKTLVDKIANYYTLPSFFEVNKLYKLRINSLDKLVDLNFYFYPNKYIGITIQNKKLNKIIPQHLFLSQMFKLKQEDKKPSLFVGLFGTDKKNNVDAGFILALNVEILCNLKDKGELVYDLSTPYDQYIYNPNNLPKEEILEVLHKVNNVLKN